VSAAAQAGTGPGRAQLSVAAWVTGMAGTAVVSLAGFFATPWLVRWLGDTRWGAWEVVGEWLGYLGLTQMALGPGALTIFLLRARTQGDPAALTAMAKRGLRLYAYAALAVAPVAVALAWFAPHGLRAAPALAPGLRWAVALVAVGSLALTPAVVFRGVLEATQRAYRVRLALMAQSLLITGLSLWWVARGLGLVGLAAATLAGLAVSAVLWRVWARRFLPDWGATPAARLAAGELWRANWPLLAAMAGNQINQLTDNTIVGLTLGAGAVAGFALTQTLPLLAGAKLADIGAVSWAALGELRARGEAAFGERMVELAASVLGLAIAGMATVAAFTPAFVRLWVGAGHYDGAGLVMATAASMAAYGFLCFFSWLFDTQGDTRLRVRVSSIGAGLNLALSLWWVRLWGVAGVAAATLTAYLCTDAWYLPRLAARRYGISGRALARGLGRAAAPAAVWAAAMAGLALRLPPAAHWAALLGEMAAAGAGCLGYCWALVLRPADRAAWRARWQDWRRAEGRA
jgi:O-antigen/teichoic acid export membrane protein